MAGDGLLARTYHNGEVGSSSMRDIIVRSIFAMSLAVMTVAASEACAQSSGPLVIDPKAKNQKPASSGVPVQPQAKPAARPASAPQGGAQAQPRNERQRTSGSRTDDKTTTGSSQPRSKPVPQFEQPQLGRIPLETGSFGFSSQTNMKSDRFPDGTRLPGPEHTRASDPSYFGLSLTVPTHDKMFSPFLRRPD